MNKSSQTAPSPESEKSDREKWLAAKAEMEESRRKAELAIAEKSQFIATISHELRTPMNGILGMVYLLNDTRLDTIQKEYIETINHSASNLLLLINDVLDLSKLEAHELLVDKTAFDIKKALLENVRLLTPLAAKKNVGLFYTIDSTIPDLVISDGCRFSQIVNNLVGNALKFTESGSVTVTMTHQAEEGQILCEVKDTGIGIPADRREAIFEKFIQGDASITQKYGGTGLGLAITKQLVVMLGGTIGFESGINRGSRFWFTLPCRIPEQKEQVMEPKEQVFSAIRKKTRHCSVLIVEDNPVNHFFLNKLLIKFGFSDIDIAENGDEALEAIAKKDKPYDVIFMDCLMPGKDGYETTRIIRQEEQQPVLIIAMTANAMAGDKEKCLQAGMDAYITKPLKPEALKDSLSEWFIFSTPKSQSENETDVFYDNMPPIDRERLNLVAETPEEQEMILGLFFRIQEDAMNIMQVSRRNAENEAWKNAAHRLKGSAANLGMKPLAYRLEKAEQAVEGSYDYRTEILEEIEEELERIRSYLGGSDGLQSRTAYL